MEAARQGHVNMLEFLLQCGADINKISPNCDATALSLACLFGHSDGVQFLLENGANPEVSLKDSVSCIIEASRNGNTDCARIVLDYISMRSKQKQLIQQQVQQQQQQQEGKNFMRNFKGNRGWSRKMITKFCSFFTYPKTSVLQKAELL